nr:odorant receptor 29 [Pachyrhinus yasumatsui]
MFSYIRKFVDDIFLMGLKRGDIIWFLNSVVSSITMNGYVFSAVFLCTLYCTVEISGDLFMLTQKCALNQILTFAPMFVTSCIVLSCCLPLMLGRHNYLRIYKAYFDLRSLKSADRAGLSEIRHVFNQALLATFVLVIFTVLAVFTLIPYREHFQQTMWPVLAGDNRNLSELKLVDDKNFQSYVACQLRACIKLDVKLRRFADLIIAYIKWIILIHIATGILLFTLLYYIFLGNNTVPGPLGFKFFLLNANLVAYLYAYYSEIFYEQIGNTLAALFETPWHTFNKSNRVLVHIFSINLTKPRFLTAGGVFNVNYSLLISVMHKVFNFLTILLQMTENMNQ